MVWVAGGEAKGFEAFNLQCELRQVLDCGCMRVRLRESSVGRAFSVLLYSTSNSRIARSFRQLLFNI